MIEIEKIDLLFFDSISITFRLNQAIYLNEHVRQIKRQLF